MHRRFLLALLVLTAIPSAPAGAIHEASMNFDLENVGPFLNDLEARAKLGLPISDLVEFTRETPVNVERRTPLIVTFRGTRVALEYRVFMDDVDAPDIYFFTPSAELAQLINAELSGFAERHGL